MFLTNNLKNTSNIAPGAGCSIILQCNRCTNQPVAIDLLNDSWFNMDPDDMNAMTPNTFTHEVLLPFTSFAHIC